MNGQSLESVVVIGAVQHALVTGEFNRTGLFDLLTDARNVLHWMRRRLPELDHRRIGLIGQSEGAVIALMLAAAEPAIPFIVLQGGPYQNLKDR